MGFPGTEVDWASVAPGNRGDGADMIVVRMCDEDRRAVQAGLIERRQDPLRLRAGIDHQRVPSAGTTDEIAVGPVGPERECSDVQGDRWTPGSNLEELRGPASRGR